MGSAVDVPRGADQIPETVIITTLRASCGGHYSIMTNPIGQATGRMAIAGSGQLLSLTLKMENNVRGLPVFLVVIQGAAFH